MRLKDTIRVTHSGRLRTPYFYTHCGGGAHPIGLLFSTIMSHCVPSDSEAIRPSYAVFGSPVPPHVESDTAPLRSARVEVEAEGVRWGGVEEAQRTAFLASLLGVERVPQGRRLPVEVCQHSIGVGEREIEDWVCRVLQENEKQKWKRKQKQARTVRRLATSRKTGTG